ncbi:MAG: tetratricopeptide repeat protein [Candidatus Heimdallarchaeota archaeon]|nr:tetratricopeptide repeat protein [Candidatus Heimdallarchaeota archaeon]
MDNLSKAEIIDTEMNRSFQVKRAEPYIILKTSFMIAMSALNRMAQVRKNRKNQEIIESINNIYQASLEAYKESHRNGNPDFSLLKKAESSMRKQYLRLFWIRLHQYGYPIRKRIQSEKEGEMDDFNRILNAGGAILREFFETRYVLPTRNEYDYANLSKENIIPDHPYIPSLDMAEIFRTHMQELAFTLFIRNVPLGKVRRYFLSFFHSCRELADWIYAGGRPGINSRTNSPKYVKKSFRSPKYIDGMLRESKRIITNENFQIGRYITKDKMERLLQQNQIKNISIDDFIKHTGVQNENSDLIQKFFIKTNIDELLRRKENKSRINGDKFHKMLLNGLPQPYSLKQVIRNGEKYNIHNLPLLIVSELSLTNYISTKRPDLVVFVLLNENHWIPIAILDVKTQFDYNYYIRGKKRNESSDDFYPVITLKTIEQSDENWKQFGYRRLRFKEKEQLADYTTIVKQEYKRWYNEEIPLLKGIIRIAPCTNRNKWPEYQGEMLDLIISVFTQTDLNENKDQTVFVKTDSTIKMSLVLDKPPSTIDQSIYQQSSEIIQRSFQYDKPTLGNMATREHILYLFARSQTSSGYSSAWIATYSHLIPYVVKHHPNDRIAMIDLVGMLSQFTKYRLRSEKSKYLSKMLDQIDIINWDLTTSIDAIDDELPEGYDVYIFSGWELYKSMITHHEMDLIQNEILNKVPSNVTIYWVDESLRREYTSKFYHQRVIAIDKHLPNQKTKIIFNLPTAPKKAADKNPQYSDARIILEWGKNDRAKSYWHPVITIRGHSSKFSNRSRVRKLSRFSNVRSDKYLQKLEIRKAFDLIPWLIDNNNYAGRSYTHYHNSPADLEISDANHSQKTGLELQLANLHFREVEWESQSTQYVDKSHINSKTLHKPPFEYSSADGITTTFPIHRNLLEPNYKLNDLERRERVRLHDTITFLRKILDDKYEKGRIAFILDLFTSIDKLINTVDVEEQDTSDSDASKEDPEFVQRVKDSIKEWELNNDNSLSSILRKNRTNAYYRHVYHIKNSPSKIKDNREFFFEFGNANYILLQVLHLEFPELNANELTMIWDDLLSFTLQMIGFQKTYDNMLKTQYNTRLIWNHLRRRAISLKQNHFVQPVLGRRDGFVLDQNDGYIWLYIEDYNPMLFRNEGFAFGGTVNQGLFIAIRDNDIIYNQSDISKDQIMVSISTTRNLGYDYIWIHSPVDKHWMFLGKLELNTIPLSKRIHSFQINRPSNISSEIPKPGGEPIEISYESILDEIKPIIRQELYLKFDLEMSTRTGFIDLTFYNKQDVDQMKENDEFDFRKLNPIHDTYFTNSHDMIEYLRDKRLDGIIKIDDIEFSFDPVKNTNWMSWIEIKDLVQSDFGLQHSRIKIDGLGFIKEFKDLLDMEPDEFETVHLILSHDSDKCRLQDKRMADIKLKIRKLCKQRRYAQDLYESIMHHRCFELKLSQTQDQLPHKTIMWLKSKFEDSLTGKELLNLLTPSLQIVENQTGSDTPNFIRIRLETEDDDILSEDKYIGNLLGKYYGIYLRKRPPGSYLLDSEYQLVSIGPSVNHDVLEVTFVNIVTGNYITRKIIGSNKECVKYENYLFGLQALQKQLLNSEFYGCLDISEDQKYKDRIQEFEDHIDNCTSHVHDLEIEKEILFEPKQIVIEEIAPNSYTLILKSVNMFQSQYYVNVESETINKSTLEELINYVSTKLLDWPSDGYRGLILEDFIVDEDMKKTDLTNPSRNKFLFDGIFDELDNIISENPNLSTDLLAEYYKASDNMNGKIYFEDMISFNEEEELPELIVESIEREWNDLENKDILHAVSEIPQLSIRITGLVRYFNENNQNVILSLSNDLMNELHRYFTPMHGIYLIQTYWIQYLTYFRIKDLISAEYCLEQIEEIFSITSNFDYNKKINELRLSLSKFSGIDFIDLAKLMSEQCRLYYRMRRYKDSLEKLELSYNIIEKMTPYRDLTEFYNLYANVLFKNSQFSEAVKYYMKQIEILKESQINKLDNERSRDIAKVHRNLARAFSFLNSFDESNKHSEEAVQISIKTGKVEDLIRARDRQISNFLAINKIEEARQLSNQNIELIREKNMESHNIIVFNYYRHISILSFLGHNDERNQCLQEIIAYGENTKYNFPEHPAYILIKEMIYSNDSSIMEIYDVFINSEYPDPYRLDALLLILNFLLFKQQNLNIIRIDMNIVNEIIITSPTEIRDKIEKLIEKAFQILNDKAQAKERYQVRELLQTQLLIKEYHRF